ncbi:MAG: cation diffusion facilitator family transporter [Anaerolineales bacterium]
MKETSLERFAYLSISAAILTMLLKTSAFFLTQSIGLLSDALESGINLVAAFSALIAIRIGTRPPDKTHAYGHQKAEFLSSGFEGGLILMAAVSISIAAVQRLLNPQPIERIGLGLLISLLASVINLVVAIILIRVGKERRSIALEADGHHLMSDVWTSGGILIGMTVVAITGAYWLDPIIAILVAVFISWTAFKLLRRSVSGLLDPALPKEQVHSIEMILDGYCKNGVNFHALRTRQAGSRDFVSIQIQVPGGWSVQQGHDLLEDIERDIRAALPFVTVFTHIEPLEDPRSWIDQGLERAD